MEPQGTPHAAPHPLHILSAEDVERCLPMRGCIEAVERALRTLAAGEATLPLRSLLWLPDRSGVLGLMPAHLGTPAAFGLKVVSVFPGNAGGPYETHQGVVMLFDPATGTPLSLQDGGAITAIRTAAASGVATRALARDDAGDLAILGSGVQARTHLEAMGAVRRLRRVRVWSRREESARRFAERESGRAGVRIEAVLNAKNAVEGADIVCTTTSAREPILLGDWLAAGAHVNAVGACTPQARELDGRAMARARVIADRMESARNEAGDFLLAVREGAIADDHLAGELGDVLIGRIAGRRTREEITVFESLGIAVEDLAAAHHVLGAARAAGAGVSVPFGAAAPVAAPENA